MKSLSTFAPVSVALLLAGSGSSDAQSATSGVPSVVKSHSEALAEASAWSDASDAILMAREQASGRKFGTALRARLRSEMSGASLSDLESFKATGATGRLPRGGVSQEVLAGTSSDLLFTAVAPCRIVNTLLGGGILAGAANRSFLVAGSAGFVAQGGSATGCGIPDDATAVEMNFIAVAPGGAGDLRAYPYDPTPVVPNASVINYDKVGSLNIANGIAQPICDASATTCTYDLVVQADVSSAHVIIDVVGYYRKAPKPVEVRTTFQFVTVPPAGSPAATLATLTFTPAATGTVLLSGRGYCNHAQLTTTHSTINIAAGLTAAVAFGAAQYGEWGVLGLPANPTVGEFQQMWTAETTLAVTAGSATVAGLFADHLDGTAGDDCGGSFTARQILQ
jgi:hypothetical protein